MKLLVEQSTFALVSPRVLRDLTGEALAELRQEFSKAWNEWNESGEFPDGRNREEFLNLFAFLVDEFERRELSIDLSDPIGTILSAKCDCRVLLEKILTESADDSA